MKNIKGLLLAVVALALVIAAVVLVIKIVHGALNTILGILVIIALVVNALCARGGVVVCFFAQIPPV